MNKLRDSKNQAAEAARWFRKAADSIERLDFKSTTIAAQAAAVATRQSRDLYAAHLEEVRNARR